MRTLFYTWMVIIGIGSMQLYAQDSIIHPKKKLGFGVKAFGGGYFFPTAFSGYPGPGAGASASFFAGRFEIESGFFYYHKFDKTMPNYDPTIGPAPYQSVFHVQDYASGYILANILIAQVKHHAFSGYLGLSIRKNIGWSTDSLMNDGTHRKMDQAQSNAQRTVGMSFLGGVRYMYFFTPRISFVAGLDLGANIYDEFHIPASPGSQQSLTTVRRPPEPEYMIGFSAGIQFILAGRGFDRE
jgi:hypothetical protein